MLVSLFTGGARAESSDRSPYGNFWFEPTGVRTLAGPRVTPVTAVQLPIVFKCVRLLATSMALMPFMLYEPNESGRGRTKLRKHWLYRLIAKRPNAFQTPVDFVMMLQGHLALRGNAYCQITDNGRGVITDLLPLHPDRMTVEALTNGNDYRYRYTDQNGRTIYYTRGEIWHLRGLSSDGVMGMSPIDVAREAIGEGLAMQGYSSRLFANDARPRGWIEYPGKFDTEATKATFRESWQKAYGGKNVGKVAVLERGMKYNQLKLDNDALQFIETRKDNRADIPGIWGIPPHKVGILDKATFSNIEQLNIEFWTDCMMPWGKVWTSSMESFLLGEVTGDPELPDLQAEFDAKPLMRGDGASRATRIRSLVLSGVMVRNEGREEEGLDPLPGLDEPLLPLNTTTIDENGDVDEPVGALPGGAKPAAPDDGSGERDQALEQRMQAILAASAGRLARRAAGALTKKPAAEVFDADFAAMVAESFGVSAVVAAACCVHLAAGTDHTLESIERALLACATDTN